MKKIVLPIVLGMFVATGVAGSMSSVAFADTKPGQKKEACADIKDAKKQAACMKKEAKKHKKKPMKDKKAEKKPAQ